MLLLHYFSPSSSLPASVSVPSLTPEAFHEVNKRVAGLATEAKEAIPVPKRPKMSHYSYSAEDSAHIGKYAVEHSPTKAAHHFSLLLKHPVPESTSRLLNKQYLTELRKKRRDGEVPEVSTLVIKACGRPLLLGSFLDGQVREYVAALRATAGVVNTAIVVAAAEGIVAATA